MSNLVPNQFPILEPERGRIAIVGASPGKQEDWQRKPFVGESGEMLNGMLEKIGLTRAECFVGNVCQRRPSEWSDDFGLLDWDGTEVQEGIAALKADLDRFKPTIVLCLGNEALHLFKNGNVKPKREKGGYDWPDKITNWRGSLFESDFLRGGSKEAINGIGSTASASESALSRANPDERNQAAITEESIPVGTAEYIGKLNPLVEQKQVATCATAPPLKCLAAFHPAAVLRDWTLQGYYHAAPGVGDFDRLKVESVTPTLTLPKRRIGIVGFDLTLHEGLLLLSRMFQERKAVAWDIEGYPGNVTSISFSRKPESALVFPLAHIDGTSRWSEEEEVLIWEGVKVLLEADDVPKVAQHGIYDWFAVAWTYGICPGGVIHDTEELFWELFPELPKSLASQCSLFTKTPFYKPDREDGEMVFDSDLKFWTYSGTDPAVTVECWLKGLALLSEDQRKHYDFNCRLFYPKIYKMLRGLRVDKDRVDKAIAETEAKAWAMQAKVDKEAGVDLSGALVNEAELTKVVTAQLCWKNPKVKAEVVIERWQPMRWNGKKWVRGGKLIITLPDNATREHTSLTCDGNGYFCGDEFLSAKSKTVEKLVPFIPATLSDCDDWVKKDNEDALKRIKRLWKGLKHEQRRKLKNRDANSRGTDQSDNGSERSDQREDKPGDCIDVNGADVADSQSRLKPDQSVAQLTTLLNLSVNVGSNEQGGDSQTFLFETCGLPRIYKDSRTKRYSRETETEWKRRVNRETSKTSQQQRSAASEDQESFEAAAKAGEEIESAAGGGLKSKSTKRLSTDQVALNKLYAATKDERVLWVLQLRRLRKAVTDLSLPLDDDGRMRFSLSFVKDTGRMAASESPLGTGTNPMALNKDLRYVVVADEGCEMGQFDLKGADSWTVAANCAALEDSTMLDDLQAGLKPAQIMCLVDTVGSEVNIWSREQIAAEIAKGLPKWLYGAHKSGHHSYDYGGGWQTLADSVLKYSMADLPLDLAETKPVVLSKADAERILECNATRYPGVKKWHAKAGRELITTGRMITSAGHVRTFFGRKSRRDGGRLVPDHDTLKQRLASEPQFYTTLAIKLAIEKLWYDDENRRDDGSLKVEPLLAVHDSLNPQWRVEDRAFALAKLPVWFGNELTIAGLKLTIPFDGTYGADWGMDGAVKI